jgi:hypothetical protein
VVVFAIDIHLEIIMSAPEGNRFWLARTTVGRDRLFDSPENLRKACIEYFDYNTNNPIMIAETVKFMGKATLTHVPTQSPLTVGALCLFLDITHKTWRNYASAEGYEDFFQVCEWAEGVIRQQKFAGACAGVFNAAIIARDLGLADKREITGKDGAPLTTINATMTPQEAAEAYASAINAE